MIEHLPLKWVVDKLNSQASRCLLRKLRSAAMLMMICLFVCAVSSAGTSKLYPPSKDQAGALRLAQVMTTATREDILKLTTQREHLLASGLQDSVFKHGSLAIGRVFFCHPSLEEEMAICFYFAPCAPGQLRH